MATVGAMALELTDRCVVVTGGAHGIGRALADAFAALGAKVVVADVQLDRAERVAARLGGLALHCDVGDPDQIGVLVETAELAFGPVEVFCSNAGIGDLGQGLASSVADIERVLAVDLLSHVWAARAVVPGMLERGRGHLVQTLSSAALISGPGPMTYTMSKQGALGFAEWLQVQHAHQGLKVTCLCPNVVNTGMMGRDEDDPRTADRAHQLGLGEVLEPEDCAEQVLAAMEEGRFLVLPHARVGESWQRKASDYDSWLASTNRRLRRMAGEEI